jgi:hypothetical protein
MVEAVPPPRIVHSTRSPASTRSYRRGKSSLLDLPDAWTCHSSQIAAELGLTENVLVAPAWISPRGSLEAAPSHQPNRSRSRVTVLRTTISTASPFVALSVLSIVRGAEAHADARATHGRRRTLALKV